MGLIAGTKKNIMALIDSLQLDPKEDDQAVATDLFLSTFNSIKLDYYNEFFGTSHWASWEDCKYSKIDKKCGQLVHSETGIKPLFLHYPGMKSNANQTHCMYRDANHLGFTDLDFGVDVSTLN